ncbi:MAG TPA: phosphatase PAP2 family protein [Acidimicrobiales bacterium]
MTGPRNALSGVRAGAAAAGVAVAGLVLSVVVAASGVGRWEVTVVEDARGVTDVVGWPARAIMQLGTTSAALAVAVAAALVRRWRAPAAVALAWALAWVVTRWAKAAVERPRPDRDLWRDETGGYGYPSGHTSVAFALATIVAALLPRRWRWTPFAAAVIVGLARMHVAVHYPMDVVGGALIGLAAGLTAVAVLDPARRVAHGQTRGPGRDPAPHPARNSANDEPPDPSPDPAGDPPLRRPDRAP